MAKRSLKASEIGITKAKRAFERTGWTQEYLAAEVGLSTRQSVWKFFSGRAIERHIFIDLCFQLNLDWQDIADLPQHHLGAEQELELNDSLAINQNPNNVEELVKLARSRLSSQIKTQCSTLQSSFELYQPLQLEQIYTNINILTNLSSQRWLEVSDLQEVCWQSERPSLTLAERQTIPIENAIALHPKLMILGKPGAGKTTLLQYLALQCNQGKLNIEAIPILIPLRVFALKSNETKDLSLFNYICQTWSCCVSAEQVEMLLQQGKILVLLDGLDEVPQQYSQDILQQIQQFAEVYYHNKIIVTCRLAAQQYRFWGFTYVELADFNETQVETFAKKWFVATAQNSTAEGLAKANHFLEQLQRQENQPLRELVTTPILLNLICSVFQERSSFPTKRAKLYQEGLDILLVRWDQTRGIYRDRTYRNLSLPDKIKLLSQIAAISFEQGNYFFEKSEVLRIIADYLLALPNTNADPETLHLDSEAVLKAIEVQHGLLIERARGIYSFSHLTFQEYLTARKIVASANSQELNQSLQKLATNISNPQWREVTLLTASMLPHADFLLQQMKEQVDLILAAEPELQKFLHFLDKKANSLTVPYQPAAVRAFYFSLFQNRDLNLAVSIDPKLASNLSEDLALDLALARANVIAITLVDNPDLKQIFNLSFALDFERTFELTEAMKQALSELKEQLPDPSQGKAQLISWWQTNGRDWVKDFHNLINQHRYQGYDWQFTNSQQKLLHQYYQANQFLNECFQSDCKLTSVIQELIATKLILPIEWGESSHLERDEYIRAEV
jgi:predicted NACHT family NTPase